MTRNREQTIEIVTQSMCNLALRTDGISIAFEDDGYDCIATFKCIYICGIEHIVCGIEDVGMVDIIQVNGYPWEEYKNVVHEFIVNYFNNNDYLKDVQQFKILLEDWKETELCTWFVT